MSRTEARRPGPRSPYGYTSDGHGEVQQLSVHVCPFGARAARLSRDPDRYERQWIAAHPGQSPGPALCRARDARAWAEDRADEINPRPAGRPDPHPHGCAGWPRRPESRGSDPRGNRRHGRPAVHEVARQDPRPTFGASTCSTPAGPRGLPGGCATSPETPSRSAGVTSTGALEDPAGKGGEAVRPSATTSSAGSAVRPLS